MYFAVFWQNNSLFKQNDGGFKKYHLWKSSYSCNLLLVQKIANFANIKQNNGVFMQKEKQVHILKLSVVANHKF